MKWRTEGRTILERCSAPRILFWSLLLHLVLQSRVSLPFHIPLIHFLNDIIPSPSEVRFISEGFLGVSKPTLVCISERLLYGPLSVVDVQPWGLYHLMIVPRWRSHDLRNFNNVTTFPFILPPNLFTPPASTAPQEENCILSFLAPASWRLHSREGPWESSDLEQRLPPQFILCFKVTACFLEGSSCLHCKQANSSVLTFHSTFNNAPVSFIINKPPLQMISLPFSLSC